MILKKYLCFTLLLKSLSLYGMQLVITSDETPTHIDNAIAPFIGILPSDKWRKVNQTGLDLRQFDSHEKGASAFADFSKNGIKTMLAAIESIRDGRPFAQSLSTGDFKKMLHTMDFMCVDREVVRQVALMCDRLLSKREKDAITQTIIDQSTKNLGSFGLTKQSLNERYMEKHGILNLENLGILSTDGLDYLSPFINRKHVITLYLNHNRLRHVSHEMMQGLLRLFPNLRNLDLSFNQITDILPHALDDLPQGFKLLLISNHISSTPESMNGYTNGFIDIRDNAVSWPQIKEMERILNKAKKKAAKRIKLRNRIINYLCVDPRTIYPLEEVAANAVHFIAFVSNKTWVNHRKLIDGLSLATLCNPFVFSLPTMVKNISYLIINNNITRYYPALDQYVSKGLSLCLGQKFSPGQHIYRVSPLDCCFGVLTFIMKVNPYLSPALNNTVIKYAGIVIALLNSTKQGLRVMFISERLSRLPQLAAEKISLLLRESLQRANPYYFKPCRQTDIVCDLPLCDSCKNIHAVHETWWKENNLPICEDCIEKLAQKVVLCKELLSLLDKLQAMRHDNAKQEVIAKLQLLDLMLEKMVANGLVEHSYKNVTSQSWNDLINNNNLNTANKLLQLLITPLQDTLSFHASRYPNIDH